MSTDYKEAGSWINNFIYQINLFFDSVYNALDKQLTFGENIKGQINTFNIQAGATPDLNNTSFLTDIDSPSGVIVISSKLVSASYTVLTSTVAIPSWRFDKGTIFIDSITGLTAGNNYAITVLVV
jgi:hypothetical protein